jgi:hypothetical protein
MNGDEGGYGVSFDTGQDVRRKKGGALQVQPTPLGGSQAVEPPPMDSPFGGGWGTDFTPDPGIPDPIPTQTPPPPVEASPDPLAGQAFMSMGMHPGHREQEQQMELPGVPGTEFVGGGPMEDPGLYGDDPYMPYVQGPPGYPQNSQRPWNETIDRGMSNYMGSES